MNIRNEFEIFIQTLSILLYWFKLAVESFSSVASEGLDAYILGVAPLHCHGYRGKSWRLA